MTTCTGDQEGKMNELDREGKPESHVPAKRKILVVGSIALLTGVLAGAGYLASTVSSGACSSPPCPAPGPHPPP